MRRPAPNRLVIMPVLSSIVLATLPLVAHAHAGPVSPNPAFLAAASPAEQANPTKDDEGRKPRRDKGLVLRGFAKTGTAGLPGIGFGGGLSVGWMRKHLRLDLMGTGRLNRSQWYPTGSVGGDFSLWRVGLRGCGVFGEGRVTTPICAGADSGLVTATGVGTHAPRTERQPWASVFADIDMVWYVTPQIGLVATSRWLVPLARRNYYIGDRGTLVTTPPFGVEIGLGLELVLP
ncbi:MAG: hypothetical protein KDK70_10865 [Myxococcales bacterium]|nr:hypothetical protein [Myxococcales bacterium]